jgi:hypothetical protein
MELGLRFPLQGVDSVVENQLIPALLGNWAAWTSPASGELHIHRALCVIGCGGASGTGKTTFGYRLGGLALKYLSSKVAGPVRRGEKSLLPVLELSVKHELQLRAEIPAYAKIRTLADLDALFYEQYCQRFERGIAPGVSSLKEVLMALVREEPGLQLQNDPMPVVIIVDEVQRVTTLLLSEFADRLAWWWQDPIFRSLVFPIPFVSGLNCLTIERVKSGGRPPVSIHLPLLRLPHYTAILRHVFELPDSWKPGHGLRRLLSSVEGPPRLFLQAIGALQRASLSSLVYVSRIKEYLLDYSCHDRPDACDPALFMLATSLQKQIYAPLDPNDRYPSAGHIQLLRSVMALVITGVSVALSRPLGRAYGKDVAVNDAIENGWALGTFGTLL